jgi:hypothetical protein
MFGVYLILFERDWKWGAPIFLVGAVWAVVITFVLVPYLWRSSGDGSGPVLRTYKQINYYCLEGETHGEMLAFVLRNPLVLLGRVFDKMTLSTLWRILLPLGVVLPFLAPDWLLIVLPSVVIMLMSCYDLRKMTGWYTASILPALFSAVAVGLDRRSERHARWLAGGLVCTTILGFALFSHAPLGAKYEPSLYAFTPHHRLAAQVVAAVPDDARVAAQDPYVPHLAHREHIYMYPWIAIGLDKVDYVLLDRNANPYPLSPSRRDRAIDDLVADTRFIVAMEADGIYLFHREGVPLPAYSLGQVADGTMKLDRVEVAIRDEEGFYQVTAQEPLALGAGQHVRVSLYWEALSDLKAERTISIRFADASGALVAQRDSMPGQGKKPTSWWQEGWRIRDVYYLTLSPQAQVGPGGLDILIYDTYSSEAVLWEDGSAVLRVVDVEMESSP